MSLCLWALASALLSSNEQEYGLLVGNMVASSLNRLRPYQREVALAVLDSVFGRKGLTFSVEIARQGGKLSLIHI